MNRRLIWERILHSYSHESGHQINASKSKIQLKLDSLTLSNYQHLHGRWKLPITNDNFLYLGAPICAKRRKAQWFTKLLANTESLSRLKKMKQLTMTGWLTLIKSILAEQPAFPFRSCPMPTSIVSQIDRCMRELLWGRTNKLHLVAWDQTCAPFNLGGLISGPVRSPTQLYFANKSSKYLWNQRT